MALTAELVARCHRVEADRGLPPGITELTEAEYETAAAALLNAKPPGPLCP